MMSVEIPRNDAGNTGLAESNQLIIGVVSEKGSAASISPMVKWLHHQTVSLHGTPWGLAALSGYGTIPIRCRGRVD